MRQHSIILLIIFFFCIASVSYSDPINTKLKQKVPLLMQAKPKATTQELKQKAPLPVQTKNRATIQNFKQKTPLPVQDNYKKKQQVVNTPIQRKIDSTSSPKTKLKVIEHAGSEGGQVMEKLERQKELGHIFRFDPKDDSQIRSGASPDIGFGGDLLEGKDKGAGLSHPGLIEKRDLLTTPTQADRESDRQAIGESFGLSTDNPHDKEFNDAMSSFGTGGAGDSRLMADDKKTDGKTSGDVTTSGEQEDGKINIAVENDKGEIQNTISTPRAPTSNTTTKIIGEAWKVVVETVGGSDKDDEGPSVGVGIRGTPVPDEAGVSRIELTPEQKAKILQENRGKIGLGGDPDEPGGTSKDPSTFKESALKLVEGADPVAPYARPTDDSGSTSENFPEFGSEQLSQQDPGTLVDPIEPELESSTGNPNQPGGGEIPIK